MKNWFMRMIHRIADINGNDGTQFRNAVPKEGRKPKPTLNRIGHLRRSNLNQKFISRKQNVNEPERRNQVP